MTSPEARTSAESESNRLPHLEATDGLLRPPPFSRGRRKNLISVLEQILGREGVTELSDWPCTFGARPVPFKTASDSKVRGSPQMVVWTL